MLTVLCLLNLFNYCYGIVMLLDSGQTEFEVQVSETLLGPFSFVQLGYLNVSMSYVIMYIIYRKRGKICWVKLIRFRDFQEYCKVFCECKRLSLILPQHKILLAKATQKYFYKNFNGIETRNVQSSKSSTSTIVTKVIEIYVSANLQTLNSTTGSLKYIHTVCSYPHHNITCYHLEECPLCLHMYVRISAKKLKGRGAWKNLF